jgi:hypothetical protein
LIHEKEIHRTLKLFKIIIPLLFCGIHASSQITTPIIKAFFGVDADARANFFNGATQGNDDWFHNGNTGSGIQIIDTNGAAAVVARYATDLNYRKASLVKGMAVPMYSTANNKLLYDALFLRDHYGNDSSTFVMSNKNGQSPSLWVGTGTSTTPSQPVLDKNDIYDVFVHLRRDGINLSDSLWFFGGISLQGNSGNRYFDFELYQTEINYNRSTGVFSNVGPHAGHTAWQFDGSGNIITAGDIIFTAEFSSSSLTLIEARIWIHKNTRSITPSKFNWGGSFDGDGSNPDYGYANISPKTSGDFYTGLQNSGSIWPGPFGYINAGGNITATYDVQQFMEISVNLTKLGLDPYITLSTSGCRVGFKRVFVKTRSSTSFTSELKDFVGPYDFGKPPALQLASAFPNNCPTNTVTQLSVTNPLPNSIYQWSTGDGSIITNPAQGTQISINAGGSYIVKQQLYAGCEVSAEDTITIVYSSTNCTVLPLEHIKLEANLQSSHVQLKWSLPAALNEKISSFTVERSTNHQHFIEVAGIKKIIGNEAYEYMDMHGNTSGRYYYRLKVFTNTGETVYTGTVSVQLLLTKTKISFYPNPVQNQLFIGTAKKQTLSVNITDANGVLILRQRIKNNGIGLDISHLKTGAYIVHVISDDGTIASSEKIMKQ